MFEQLKSLALWLVAHYLELGAALLVLGGGVLAVLKGYVAFFKVIPGDQGEAKVEKAEVAAEGLLAKLKKLLGL